jgi:hypothetical protein
LAAHKKNAHAEGAHVVLIDESGAFLSPLVRRTLAPRGRTPILKVPGRKCQKVSLIAGLSIAPRRHRIGPYFHTYGDRHITQHEAAAFPRDLPRHLRGISYVIWDPGTTHRGEAIRNVLKGYPRMTLPLTREFRERMDDVLSECEAPYDPDEPRINLDEKPLQLLEERVRRRPSRPSESPSRTTNIYAAARAAFS